MLLAASCAELFKREAATYSPLLAAHQPQARVVAAATLHEVYGAKMLPWLIGGERPAGVPPVPCCNCFWSCDQP